MFQVRVYQNPKGTIIHHHLSWRWLTSRVYTHIVFVVCMYIVNNDKDIYVNIHIYIYYTHELMLIQLLSGTMCIYTCLFWDVELCRKPRFFCLPRWGLGLPKSGWGSRQTWRIEGAIWDPRDDVGNLGKKERQNPSKSQGSYCYLWDTQGWNPVVSTFGNAFFDVRDVCKHILLSRDARKVVKVVGSQSQIDRHAQEDGRHVNHDEWLKTTHKMGGSQCDLPLKQCTSVSCWWAATRCCNKSTWAVDQITTRHETG